MLDHKQEIEDKGGHVAVIGNGAVNYLGGFVDRFGRDLAIYTDPRRSSYRAMELRRGQSLKHSLQMTARGAQALAKGHIQGRLQGNAAQMGGTFVIDRDGQLLYSHRDQYAGDHARLDEVIAALTPS